MRAGRGGVRVHVDQSGDNVIGVDQLQGNAIGVDQSGGNAVGVDQSEAPICSGVY